MKLLFKLYLLGQLIALPFMIGTLGDIMASDSNNAVNPNIIAESNSTAESHKQFCDALHGEPTSAVQDDIQQLRYITSSLFGDDLAADCFDAPALTRP